jgi:YggT family protein
MKWKKIDIFVKLIAGKMILYIVNTLFTTYTFMLLARVLGTWIPGFANSRFMHFLSFYTDPYLNLFRKIIPPLGMLDLSPMVAFFVLQIVQWVLVAIL